MAKKIVELSTKRKVELKEMSIDEMDYCSDVMTLSTNDRGESIINNMSKSRTAWIRRSVIGGDFKSFKKGNDGFPADSVLKELSDDEKNELVSAIQEYQKVGE